MLQAILIDLFERDLIRLSEEIKAYKTEENLWILSGEIKNTAGNLCMHLIGNLNHFIGHALGNTTYKRNRDFEFEGKNIPIETLLQQIEETKLIVKKVVENLTDAQLETDFPIRVFDREHSTAHFLMHLSTHLNYHLGQINYHRRISNF